MGKRKGGGQDVGNRGVRMGMTIEKGGKSVG